jgi:hypothetical protein
MPAAGYRCRCGGAAETLATYARLSEDEALFVLARRVQLRAWDRMGELLKQFDGQGARTDLLGTAADTKLTQRQAAEAAGISKRQQVTAVRINSVPEERARGRRSRARRWCCKSSWEPQAAQKVSFMPLPLR